jgi:hypothetical protein
MMSENEQIAIAKLAARSPRVHREYWSVHVRLKIRYRLEKRKNEESKTPSPLVR